MNPDFIASWRYASFYILISLSVFKNGNIL